MFGWINDCTECLVISKFGEETWHKIKETAGCTVSDGGFLRYKYYPDSDTVQLVVAASQVLGISVDDVLYAFGDYFIDYVQDNGYANVLECLGSNMRDWLSNLNSLHDHLQASYPKGFVAPVFWSEDDEGQLNHLESAKKLAAEAVADNSSNGDDTGTVYTVGGRTAAILVHYYSQRGSLLVPLVVGLIHKLAKSYFDLDIRMDQLQLQDEDSGVPHTTWRVTTADPEEAHKLRGKKRRSKKRAVLTGSDADALKLDHNDNETVTTTATGLTNPSKYPRAFREGGAQAKNLRVEELIKRSFYNETCELYHALTLEHYWYLIQYWKAHPIQREGLEQDDGDEYLGGDKQGEGLWCYEIWNLIDDEPSSWPSIQDLPPELHPETMDRSRFGGVVPQTGAYPPEVSPDTLRSTPRSVPPKLRIYVNEVACNGTMPRFVDVTVPKDPNYFLDDTVYKAEEIRPMLQEEGLTVEELSATGMEIQCVVWNPEGKEAYHTFAIGDLSATSTKQLFELVPKSYDPIPLVFQRVEGIAVDDDEEDI